MFFQFNNSVNAMTMQQIIAEKIAEFSGSQEREWMITGDRYYRVDNDILYRVMYKNMPDGSKVIDTTKANNKLAHGFTKLLVDEKVNYLLGKEYSLQCDDKAAVEKVKDTLGKKFPYTLSGLGYEASNKGIAWLQVYIDEAGNFRTMLIPSEQCVPIWTDNSHTELEGMIRYYIQVYYEGQEKKEVTKVEYWTAEGIQFYELIDNTLVLDIERLLQSGYNDYGDWVPHYKKGGEGKNWGKVPFVCFKNNRIEYPDARFIKSLVDGYDFSRSNVDNFIEEVKNLIYILRNYGGQDLAEFMDDLNYFRAVKVDDDGGVDTLNPSIDINAAKEHYERLKRDIQEFGQGTNKDLDKLGSSPSGIALKFLYSGLDLKCNAIEPELVNGFENLLFFIDVYLSEKGKGSIQDADIDIIFNRDIAINETDTINNCVNSKGIISDETIVANHPWVRDVEDELARAKNEKAESIKQQQAAFGINQEINAAGSQGNNSGNANGGGVNE